MMNDLVSIIMYTHNNEKYVGESIESVISQTYTNWELLLIDDSSKDKTLDVLLSYMRKDKRILVCHYPYERGKREVRNTALRGIHGRYVGLLNAGDLWDSNKLEKQLSFMEEYQYPFSYTKYRLIDEKSREKGIEIGGPKRITRQDMMKCCWPCYMTVIYDAKNLGLFQVKFMKMSNEYALLLQVCSKSNCYLMEECLASNRVYSNLIFKLSIFRKLLWRFEVYRTVTGMNPLLSFFWSMINVYYSIKRKIVYAQKYVC